MPETAGSKEARYVISLSRTEDQETMEAFKSYCKEKGLRWSTEVARIIREDMEIRKLRGKDL